MTRACYILAQWGLLVYCSTMLVGAKRIEMDTSPWEVVHWSVWVVELAITFLNAPMVGRIMANGGWIGSKYGSPFM
jgi:hypothetical protein